MLLKFKAWDKKRKRLAKVIAINLYLKQVVLKDITVPFEDAEIIESTGLKDKNGTEIYCGYIVKGTRIGNETDGELIETVGVVKQSFCELIIEDSHGTYDPFLNYYDGVYGDSIAEIEVLGNIYENPELMEV